MLQVNCKGCFVDIKYKNLYALRAIAQNFKSTYYNYPIKGIVNFFMRNKKWIY